MSTSIKTRIARSIANSRDDKEFSRGDFVRFGGYDQVGRALREIQSDGKLVKIGRGCFRKPMPESGGLTGSERKSVVLGLDFPYDWSNSNMDETSLIMEALERAHLPDITRLVIAYGSQRVNGIKNKSIHDPYMRATLDRMLRNILQGVSRAQHVLPA